jgi:hypothetical protein
VEGYLLHYNATGRVNATNAEWNLVSEATIESGDQSRYEMFATDQLGTDEGVVASGAEVSDIWERGVCRVEEFSDNRNGEGAINISDGANASVDCPFNGIAKITGGQIREGGRLADGDEVKVIWSAEGSPQTTVLNTHEI